MFLILFSISLCFSWVSPVPSSLTVIYTVTFGIEDFPQVTGAAIVNGVQTGYYDSNIQRCIPRQQFMAEYFKMEFWDHLTEKAKTHTNLAKQNLNTIMKSTNLTSGKVVHMETLC
ncbi:hypothetical protein scyTo_0020524 [Scyliorhinus torazame]|uniref:MHC class I-like antigen recognition-like domain-containing protein n=1 Tax=Scyliorhinus torazame TaxID=75743 RepID=A0A401PUY1_SCYTO|nr:hypothetical protein [Scyliorhinus torazame]